MSSAPARGRGRPHRRAPRHRQPQPVHPAEAAHHARPAAPPAAAPDGVAPGPTPPVEGRARFRDFSSLSEELLRAIPFDYCTDVQAATLPSILDNHDVLAQAKTGTGKTLAFLVPSIERLLSGPIPLQSHTSILVLSPTRELAAQIGVAAEGLLGGEKGRFGVRCVVGGTNIETDKRNLKTQRADILVATPGRLVDLLENGGIKPRFSQLSTLVLDEADRLLDAGFRKELLKILNALPDRNAVPRQTLLFSATIPSEVHTIASIALSRDHHFISTLKEEDVNAHEHVVQEILITPGQDLLPAAFEVLRREEELATEREGFKVMVFLPTARAAALYHDVFSALPIAFPVWEIHSRMSQSKRTKSTDEFRAAEKGVLFSSDVTARGIDVKGVTSVIQVGLPSSAEQYVHRLGRTARAGAEGHGTLVLGDFETFFLNDKTIRTFNLHPYPNIAPASLAHARAQIDRALDSVPEDAKAQAYQAWLGYYNSNQRSLKWSQSDLVRHANDYARLSLRSGGGDGEWKPPGLLAKTVGKMGLKGVPGLNIVKEQSGGGRAPGQNHPGKHFKDGDGPSRDGAAQGGGRHGRGGGAPRGRGRGRGGRSQGT